MPRVARIDDDIVGRYYVFIGSIRGKKIEPEELVRRLREKVLVAQVFREETLSGPLEASLIASGIMYYSKKKRLRYRSVQIALLALASGERQIERAIRVAGVEAGSSEACIILADYSEDSVKEAVKGLELEGYSFNECRWSPPPSGGCGNDEGCGQLTSFTRKIYGFALSR